MPKLLARMSLHLFSPFFPNTKTSCCCRQAVHNKNDDNNKNNKHDNDSNKKKKKKKTNNNDIAEAWWPALRTGGVLAGHDYILVHQWFYVFKTWCFSFVLLCFHVLEHGCWCAKDYIHPGVVQAAHEFAVKMDLELTVAHAMFWIVKP
ncbi:unnamed protein product [Polarella glacialis]|uniref:Uncharacterized protein n=1 Tax=Polarella glacialis TaxID=89957 RepID=A0A813JTT4_POLGL|nr:unnamed protein product [Polarella glacialis]